MNRLPLDGVRVVEFAHMVMGPSCGLVLADLGAEVIKVEPLEGDNTRRLEAAGAGFFPVFNRNKKSLAVDLKRAEGRDMVLRLLDASDVLTENFRPGALDKLGFGSEALAARNPRLVYCSLKGFLDGPYQHRPALDEVVQMMGGLAYMTGLPERPLRAGSSVVDILGGTFGAVAVLAALRERESTGRGARVTSALFESTAYLVAQHMAQYEITGEAPPPMSVKRPAWSVYDIFETGDGDRLFVGVVTDTQWEIFCREFGQTELAADPRLRTNGARVRERAWLIPRLGEAMKRFSKAELEAKLERIGLPYRADRQALGPAQRSAPHRLRRVTRDAAALGPHDPRSRPADRLRRRAPAKALRPAADRRRRARRAAGSRLWRGADRRARRRGGHFPAACLNSIQPFSSASMPACTICSSSCDATPEAPMPPMQLPSTLIGSPPCTGSTGILSIDIRPPATRSSHVLLEHARGRRGTRLFDRDRGVGRRRAVHAHQMQQVPAVVHDGDDDVPFVAPRLGLRRRAHLAAVVESQLRSSPHFVALSFSALRICSSAPGSSMVVRSPGSRPSASAWIERRSVLPERVFGSSVTKCTARGRAIAPSCLSTVSMTSFSSFSCPSGEPA